MNVLRVAAVVVAAYMVYFALARVRKKRGFWAKQPAMHHQSWVYTYICPRPTGVIESFPNKDVLLAPLHVSVVSLQDILQSNQMKEVVQFIRLHYLHNRTTGNSFTPQMSTVVPFFEKHAFPCYLSIYQKPYCPIQGVLTTRPLYVYFPGEDQRTVMQYYDYLCVDRAVRGKSVAAQIIQGHLNYVRQMHASIQCGIFKREDELTDIVPLVQYSTKCFDMHAWDCRVLNAHVVEIVAHSVSATMDFLLTNRTPIFAVPHLPHMEHLVQTNNLWIYATTSATSNQIHAVFFFRASNVSLAHGKSVVHCIGSLHDKTLTTPEFTSAFYGAVALLMKKIDARYMAIEYIADNCLLDIAHCTSMLTSPTAYYLHNYSCRDAPYLPQSCFILS